MSSPYLFDQLPDGEFLIHNGSQFRVGGPDQLDKVHLAVGGVDGARLVQGGDKAGEPGALVEIDALLLAGVDVLIRKELLPLLKGEPGQGVKDAGGAFQLRGLVPHPRL